MAISNQGDGDDCSLPAITLVISNMVFNPSAALTGTSLVETVYGSVQDPAIYGAVGSTSNSVTLTISAFNASCGDSLTEAVTFQTAPPSGARARRYLPSCCRNRWSDRVAASSTPGIKQVARMVSLPLFDKFIYVTVTMRAYLPETQIVDDESC